MSFDTFTTWTDAPASLHPELSIVIPAYNESERIVPTIISVAAQMCQVTTDFEIIVSDDGSSDGTPDLVRGLGFRNLVVVDPGVNRGKGAAVRAGVGRAAGRMILFSDADMSTPMKEVTALQRRIDAGADVAIGSRGCEGASEAEKSALRRMMSWGWRRMTRLALGLDVADTQCGFKLFTRDAAMQLFGSGVVEGFSFDAELLFLAAKYDLEVAEVPVEWFDAPGSKVRAGRVAIEFLLDTAKIRWRDLRGVYPSDPTALNAPIRAALVTAVPPSEATLTEYGGHMAAQLASNPDVAELTVLAEDSAGLPDDVDGIEYVAGWTFDSLMNPIRLVREIRRRRPDAAIFNIHFTSFGSGKVAAALGLMTPALVSRFTRTRSVVLLHNIVDTVDLERAGYSSGRLVDSVLRAIGRFLTRVILRADVVMTTMPEYVEILRDRYGADNVWLTPHGSFEVPGEPLPEPSDGPFRILTFGKFGTYKRVDHLIAAHAELRDRGYDVECVIAGTDSPVTPGYLDEVRANAADVDGLRFTGYVAEEDVAPTFADSHVVVFPYTSTTGSSGPLHQAGSYGRAAVVPQVGDFVDLIEREGFAGSTFDADDPTSLADAIARLIDDEDERRRLARTNFAAASSLPLAEITDWHVQHARGDLAGVAA